MRTSALARRYARALLELASAQKEVEAVAEQLAALDGALRESSELAATLFNPTVGREAKRTIAAAVLDKLEAGQTMQNFVGLLIAKGRIAEFPLIAGEFARMSDELTGRVRATVHTAAELPAPMKKRIVEKLSKVTGKKVEIEEHVNPELLGGIVAEVDGVTYDASLRTQLRALRADIN